MYQLVEENGFMLQRPSSHPVKKMNAAGLLVCLILLAGCSAIEVYEESRYLHAGDSVPAAVFSQITPNQTTQSWVLDYLGEPTKKITLENGVEHWIYPLLMEHRSGGRIILLYSGVSVEHESRYFNVLVSQGVVDKAWYSMVDEALLSETAAESTNTPMAAVSTIMGEPDSDLTAAKHNVADNGVADNDRADNSMADKNEAADVVRHSDPDVDVNNNSRSESSSAIHASTIRQSRTFHKP